MYEEYRGILTLFIHLISNSICGLFVLFVHNYNQAFYHIIIDFFYSFCYYTSYVFIYVVKAWSIY